ncbi:hypothetical protein J2W91_004657 [Paenibacillus amylolyticus]|uniref:Uncharacterized protein n=1 Tax=Paenibacillus amylolyticus TaxID=1451 RepID=A0AAP5H909_PAEAM|nr:hypothetical protein [Paenibacillus amylolyticus]MDR6726151.1 hypothetical protein [Paenibacillus amylolyticus]
MNKKKKIFISTGSIIGLATISSLVFLFGSGASKQESFDANSSITLEMKEDSYAAEIPPGFDDVENLETAQKLGLSSSNNNSLLAMNDSSNNSLTINQEIKKDGELFVGEGGTGELILGGKKHNFNINSSNISHAELENGHNLLTGSFESEITDNNGHLVPTTITFTRIVETDDQFFYVAIGTIEEGPVVLSFGDDSFGTEEIYRLVREQANIEEESY